MPMSRCILNIPIPSSYTPFADIQPIQNPHRSLAHIFDELTPLTSMHRARKLLQKLSPHLKRTYTTQLPPREVMDYDVLIVGGGPSGLCSAIRLKQLAQEKNKDLSVCLIEKGSDFGSHILSGACIEPKSLDELLPGWREMDCPLQTKATKDRMYFLTEKKAFYLPIIPQMNNHGNYIGSLGNLVKWFVVRGRRVDSG